MSVLGITGKTAYCGLLDIGNPQPGETVVVSAAAGATGSIAAQIAKIKGARVVGIAGGAGEMPLARRRTRLDDAIDHREGNVYATLKAAVSRPASTSISTTPADRFSKRRFRA